MCWAFLRAAASAASIAKDPDPMMTTFCAQKARGRTYIVFHQGKLSYHMIIRAELYLAVEALAARQGISIAVPASHGDRTLKTRFHLDTSVFGRILKGCCKYVAHMRYEISGKQFSLAGW